jgi:hypothetical protein
MIPRAVQMAAYVATQIDTEELGNILAPFYKSWPNNWGQYYTSGDNQGLGTMFAFNVHSFTTGGAPRWAQPPARDFGNRFTGYMYPVADNTTAPAIGGLT